MPMSNDNSDGTMPMPQIPLADGNANASYLIGESKFIHRLLLLIGEVISRLKTYSYALLFSMSVTRSVIYYSHDYYY